MGMFSCSHIPRLPKAKKVTNGQSLGGFRVDINVIALPTPLVSTIHTCHLHRALSQAVSMQATSMG